MAQNQITHIFKGIYNQYKHTTVSIPIPSIWIRKNFPKKKSFWKFKNMKLQNVLQRRVASFRHECIKEIHTVCYLPGALAKKKTSIGFKIFIFGLKKAFMTVQHRRFIACMAETSAG